MRSLLAAAAAAVGAIWGATIALTLNQETVLLDVGRFLAVAFAAGSLTRDVRVGAPAGTAMALAHFGAMELLSPTLLGAEIIAQDQGATGVIR